MKKSNWLVRWNKNSDKTLNKVWFVTTVAPGLKKHVVESILESIYQDCVLSTGMGASSNPILTNNQ